MAAKVSIAAEICKRPAFSHLYSSKWQIVWLKDEGILEIPGDLVQGEVGLHRDDVEQNCEPEPLDVRRDEQWRCESKDNQQQKHGLGPGKREGRVC